MESSLVKKVCTEELTDVIGVDNRIHQHDTLSG